MFKSKKYLRVVSSLCAASIAATLLCTSPVSAATVTEDEVSASSARKAGDVNGDGKVTDADATLLQKYLAGLTSLNSAAKKAADINRDGIITINDVTLIQQYNGKPFKIKWNHNGTSSIVGQDGKVYAGQKKSKIILNVECANSNWYVDCRSAKTCTGQEWIKCKKISPKSLEITVENYYIFSRARNAKITLTNGNVNKKSLSFNLVQKFTNSAKRINEAKYGTVIYYDREYKIRVPQAGEVVYNSTSYTSKKIPSIPNTKVNWLEFIAGFDLGVAGDIEYPATANFFGIFLAINEAFSRSTSSEKINMELRNYGDGNNPDTEREVLITRHTTEMKKFYDEYSYKYNELTTSAYWRLSGQALNQSALNSDVKALLKEKNKLTKPDRDDYDMQITVARNHYDSDLVSYLWINKNHKVMETPYREVGDKVEYGYGYFKFTPTLTLDYKALSKPVYASKETSELFYKNLKTK